MVVRPDDRQDLIKTIKGILEPTRVEKGCLDYQKIIQGDKEIRKWIHKKMKEAKEKQSRLRAANL